ncbi:hypothetical protein BDN67DRAFT_974989 [Paxillus ammoniavirescens]|nr:hypothetical protein BDN67DRAFT_974989 [Paxillus ammoniavirescens]
MSCRRQHPTIDRAPNTPPSHCQLTSTHFQSSSAKPCPSSIAASATHTHLIVHVTWPCWSR